MLKVFIGTASGPEVDYSQYVDGTSISITRSLNVPSTCTMTMMNNNNGFALPALRSYVRIYSTQTQRNLFTGFLTNDPSRNFLGLGKPTGFGGQLFQFQLNLTSDEYLLNIKSVRVIPAFVNQPQGSIIQTIAETLCPGFYDFTYCASGDIVPFLQYDPSKSWSEIVKDFADASRFRYSVIDKQIHFQPYGDDALGISYDEDKPQSTFNPMLLKTQATTTPIVNDVTIIGAQEGGNNHEDFFIGDGFTGAFPLRHKVFGASSSQGGSSILLSDNWNGTELNSQNWIANDPSNNFFYGAVSTQALNILTGISHDPGSSSIVANNAVELAGGLVLQHGQIVFNDSSEGIIGGVYDSTILNGFGEVVLDESKMECGFKITPTAIVEVTASGAAGISIQPFRNGAVPAKSFWGLNTKVNCSYILTTTITAPAPSRYNQTYRSMAGVVFGGNDASTEILGTITWSVVETNLFTGVQTTYTFTEKDQLLPQTAVYALVDNVRLNITLNTTYITAPIPGSLNVTCKVGAGLLAPIYVSGNVQYTGAFVTPSGGNLPILPNNFGPENNFALGTSLQNAAAEVDSGQVTDTLNFYSDDLPGVGVRIRLQTWESQAAISRIQEPTSITEEALIVGDNGIRAATVSNLVPLPRSSEDCDFAAQAFLEDRTGIFYQGSYTASFKFFSQRIQNIDFYPTCGRYLYVNCPARNIVKQNFIVTSCTLQVEEMAGEIMTHNISFGPDLFLDKLLSALVPQSTNVLTPIDTTVPPTTQQLLSVGTNFLPDVQQTTVSHAISGAQFVLSLKDAVPPNSHYEIRQADLNWGNKDGNLLATAAVTGDITLPRSSFDQTWFIRLAETLPNGTILSSRRTKVIRIFYPRVPTLPAYVRSDSNEIFVDFSGDTRNIEGIELRSQDDATVYYQAIVGSEFDMDLQLNTLRGQLSPGQVSTGPIGQFQIAKVPPTQRNFVVHFFNLMWEYSPGLTVAIPPPAAPTLREGYRFGSMLQLIQTPNDPIFRNDINYSTLQIANDPGFNVGNILIALQTVGNPGTFAVTVPTTGDLYARSSMTDFISSGAWSQTLHVLQTNLIASDYLSSQGSVPPAVTQALGGSGGIFSYTSTDKVITMACLGFGIQYPNGSIDVVPASTANFSLAWDQPGGLTPSTLYGFFPYLDKPTTPNPVVFFNGAFLNYTGPAASIEISYQFADGRVPLTNGVFVAQTAAAGGTVGGGGGGTDGGGNCGEISRLILCADGSRCQLKDLAIGQRIQNVAGRVSKIKTKHIMLEDTFRYKTQSGLETETALGHVLYANGEWQALHTILDDTEISDDIRVLTVNDNEDKIIEFIAGDEQRYICKIELEPCDKDKATDDDHVYNLDGFWTHNFVIKNDIGVALPL